MEEQLRGKLLKIAIHTYDPYNDSGTERPHVSLVTRTIGYQLESRMPFGVFDPLYPDILAEFTVDRVLRDRISLTLKKIASLSLIIIHIFFPKEVQRFVTWYGVSFHGFSNALRMPTLRQLEILHMVGYGRCYKIPTSDLHKQENYVVFFTCIDVRRWKQPDYTNILSMPIATYTSFVSQDNKKIVTEYRNSQERCMSLGIEVRKDLVWKFDKDGIPIEPQPDFALRIAKKICQSHLHLYA